MDVFLVLIFLISALISHEKMSNAEQLLRNNRDTYIVWRLLNNTNSEPDSNSLAPKLTPSFNPDPPVLYKTPNNTTRNLTDNNIESNIVESHEKTIHEITRIMETLLKHENTFKNSDPKHQEKIILNLLSVLFPDNGMYNNNNIQKRSISENNPPDSLPEIINKYFNTRIVRQQQGGPSILEIERLNKFFESLLHVVNMLTEGQIDKESSTIEDMVINLLNIFTTLLKTKTKISASPALPPFLVNKNLTASGRHRRSVLENFQLPLLPPSQTRIARDTELQSIQELARMTTFLESLLGVVNMLTEGEISKESNTIEDMISNLLNIFNTLIRNKHTISIGPLKTTTMEIKNHEKETTRKTRSIRELPSVFLDSIIRFMKVIIPRPLQNLIRAIFSGELLRHVVNRVREIKMFFMDESTENKCRVTIFGEDPKFMLEILKSVEDRLDQQLSFTKVDEIQLAMLKRENGNC